MGLLPKVTLRAPKRSNCDLSKTVRTTVAPGILYPIYCEECVAGDKIKLNMSALVKTYPLLAPLMGTFKLQFDTFYVPMRLYLPEWKNNVPGNVNFDEVSFPYITVDEFTYSEEATGVAAGSIYDYFGFPVGYQHPFPSKRFNGIPYVGYYDIFANYYLNQQEDTFRIFGLQQPFTGSSILDTAFNLLSVRVDVLQDRLHNWKSGTKSVVSPLFLESSRHEGLVLRTYRPDQHTAILNRARVMAAEQRARVVSVPTGSSGNTYFTMDQLRMGSKMARFLNTNIVAGSRFSEWIRAHFGVKPSDKLDIPEYLGTTSTYMNFEDVVQTADVSQESPLGSLAGRGYGFMSGRNHYFDVLEPGYLMVMMSIVPLVDYFQGVRRMWNKLQYTDCFIPEFDGLGYQDVLRSELSAFPAMTDGVYESWTATSNPFTTAIGKQPAWLEYMTAVNELHGDFADTLRYWTLGRNFMRRGSESASADIVFDPTSYVIPWEFNYAFADTSPHADNFLVQVKFDALYKRPISKQLVPTL